eukprot:1022214-Prymnesium_polylepis.1
MAACVAAPRTEWRSRVGSRSSGVPAYVGVARAVNAWDCAVARSESSRYSPMCFLRSPSKPRLRNGYFLPGYSLKAP